MTKIVMRQIIFTNWTSTQDVQFAFLRLILGRYFDVTGLRIGREVLELRLGCMYPFIKLLSPWYDYFSICIVISVSPVGAMAINESHQWLYISVQEILGLGGYINGSLNDLKTDMIFMFFVSTFSNSIKSVCYVHDCRIKKKKIAFP